EPRLQVKALHKNVIEALVITGCARGFCFAETINKSKGQSLIMAGIGLREECFSHGQFYVTCFRVSSATFNGQFEQDMNSGFVRITFAYTSVSYTLHPCFRLCRAFYKHVIGFPSIRSDKIDSR
ncbi:ATP-dependent DNA helicase PIF1-like, partial [Aphis craccivora]